MSNGRWVETHEIFLDDSTSAWDDVAKSDFKTLIDYFIHTIAIDTFNECKIHIFYKVQHREIEANIHILEDGTQTVTFFPADIFEQ